MNKKRKKKWKKTIREDILLLKGFKKEYLENSEDYWFKKKGKLGEFTIFYYFDNDIGFIDICGRNEFGDKTSECIWKGNYKGLLKRIERYE